MDDAIATVVTVTGSTPELAAQYVQLADGDPNQAVQLFFENGGVDLAGSSSSQPPPPTTSHATGGAQDPIDLDADENISDNDPEVTGLRTTRRPNVSTQPTGASNFEDDEALARRLQEEMYGGAGVDQEIRAPIARQAETLVGPEVDALPLSGAAYSAAVEARMRAFERRRNQRGYYSGIAPFLTDL